MDYYLVFIPGGLAVPSIQRFNTLASLAIEAATISSAIASDPFRYGRARLVAFRGHRVGLVRRDGLLNLSVGTESVSHEVAAAQSDNIAFAFGG